MNECRAVQHSDQMVCDRCQLVWDVNDLEPPACELWGMVDSDAEEEEP